MDPGTLLTIASTAMSAVGAISHGNAEAADARAQAQMQSYQALTTRNNANEVADEYAARENAQMAQEAQTEGRLRARVAEAGIGTDSPTGDALVEQDTINDRLNDLTLQHEGQDRRTDLLNNASLDDYQSRISDMNAGADEQQGYMGALGDVLKGATGIYDRYSSTTPSSAAARTAASSSPIQYERGSWFTNGSFGGS